MHYFDGQTYIVFIQKCKNYPQASSVLTQNKFYSLVYPKFSMNSCPYT